jgi:hypothetical protein
VSGIGAIARPSSASVATPGPAGLDAQKERVQKQLADCVNCSSASTPEGKAKIEKLSAQLSAVDARLQEAVDARPASAHVNLGNRVDVYA